jgi:uncharacterized protein YydD (DUF2326 family)
MFQLVKLYTEPTVIDPIEFSSGLNLILGETDETSDKTNGVGKSLSIEFLNFALLKRKTDSRVSQIPKDAFSPDTLICLDFLLNNDKFTIQRSLSESETPTIIEKGTRIPFAKVEDANAYLTEKLFSNSDQAYPSFRVMLGPLIRDERSEFKSLIGCYDTKSRIPDNYSPHLFLLGVDITVYHLVKQYITLIDDVQNDLKKIKENVLFIRQKDIDDARSDLNELDDEVKSIEASIDKLENTTGYELVRTELIRLEEEIEKRRRQKGILKIQLSKLKPVSQKVDISIEEIGEFYDNLKAGLGDLIKKSLDETIAFKDKIDEFQNRMISERKSLLQSNVSQLDKELDALDKQYSAGLSVINQNGNLKNLKQTYAAFKDKSDQLSQLRGFVDRYDELVIDKQRYKANKEQELLRLQSIIQEQRKTIESFEKTILDIHEFVQGNKQASFQLRQVNKVQVVEMTMRIADDGSHSVEREKTFIYDIALLLNEFTSKRHPGFLIHDNIFDVDQDTLERNLRYLHQKANFNNKQYILTLNADRINPDSLSSLAGYVKGRFTKHNRFLKAKYQETRNQS